MDVFEIDAFGEDTGAQVLADFVFVPGEQLKYGESPVIGSIEQENWRIACSDVLCVSFDFVVCF